MPDILQTGLGSNGLHVMGLHNLDTKKVAVFLYSTVEIKRRNQITITFCKKWELLEGFNFDCTV